MIDNNQPNTSIPETKNENQSTVNLVKMAAFIQQRQAQKFILQQHRFNKNSLSKYKSKKQETIKTTNNQKIDDLFQQLNNQLIEGHTIYPLITTVNNTSYYQQLFAELSDESWLSVLTNGTAIKSQSINTPIVVMQLNPTHHQSNNVYSSDYILWLHRHWYAEHLLAQQLLTIANRVVAVLDFPNTEQYHTNANVEALTPNKQQQQAIEKATHQALSIIIGGPGTGKTFTVAQLVMRLQQGYAKKRSEDPNLPPLSITLTAPTGKAAQRMQLSLQKSLQHQKITLDNAKTIHRLLGIGNDGSPRYHANNPLPDDLVIVDEASMLGLELASMLVDAIKPTGRLILLGDANQLAAVDAGAVLADLCQVSILEPYITELTESKRFDEHSKVGKFAKIIQQTLPSTKKNQQVFALIQPINIHNSPNERVVDMVQNNGFIPWYDIQANTPMGMIYQQLAKPYQQFFELLKAWYITPVDIHNSTNRQKLFDTFDSYRILSAGRQGLLGVETINQKMAGLYFEHTQLGRLNNKQFFYHGLPIIINNNDYQLGLFNGDIGICLLYEGQLWVCFTEQVIPVHRLSIESCGRAYAMTIHKSQGSEFNQVAICIDKAHTRLLSQELIYTAVTRSKTELAVYSAKAMLEKAITQKGVRQTGLQLQFDMLANQ